MRRLPCSPLWNLVPVLLAAALTPAARGDAPPDQLQLSRRAEEWMKKNACS